MQNLGGWMCAGMSNSGEGLYASPSGLGVRRQEQQREA